MYIPAYCQIIKVYFCILFLLDDDDDDPEDEDDDIQEAVGVLMYLVQPKSMQECRIRFIPPLPESDLPLSTIIPDSLGK